MPPIETILVAIGAAVLATCGALTAVDALLDIPAVARLLDWLVPPAAGPLDDDPAEVVRS